MAEEKKFTNIDPNTCSLDELEKEIQKLDDLCGYYETKQLALKQFINSVYGATASQYFIAHNVLVAESITLQGQDLNHFSENSVNAYFKGIFQNDTKLHQELGIKTEDAQKVTIDGGRVTQMTPLIGEQYKYLNGDTSSLTVAGDTDSVDGGTKVKCDDDTYRISELFTKLKYENGDTVLRISDGSEIVPVKSHLTDTFDGTDKCQRPIKYIMRHKVSKERYKITSVSGKSVIVTGDHSCMVMRDGKLIDIKAKDIDAKTDKLVTIR